MDIWKHGQYADLWSLVHFLSGMLIGIACAWIGFTVGIACVATAFLLIAWELYEWVLKIVERPLNVATDLIFGIVGFATTAYWYYGLGFVFDLQAVALLASATALVSLWGFADLLFRGYR